VLHCSGRSPGSLTVFLTDAGNVNPAATGSGKFRFAEGRIYMFGKSAVQRLLLVAMALATVFLVDIDEARAEYGDVVINNYSDAAGMRPAIFPHWFHRVRFRCKVCHADLGFKFKAGGNEINMVKIIDGQFCGACHNGELAWSVENCNLCHSGKPGTPTQVHESTVQKLAPAALQKK
jgi:c(7)-type cytochrome triheme protein